MAIVRSFFLFTPSSLPARPVGSWLGALTASPNPERSTRSPRSVAAPPAGRHQRRNPAASGAATLAAARNTPLCVVILLLSVAVLLAPEQPQDQEAICQRHRGELACRVW